MRILLIEDDVKTASFIMKGLKEEGYAVEHRTDGRDGFITASAYEFDILIIDIMLPTMDGLSILRSIAELKKDLGIIILSAKHSTDVKVKAFELGADDYITKPFAFSELSARVMALIRRKTPDSAVASELSYRDLRMNLLTREVRRSETVLELQPKEFALLEFFMRSLRRVVTRTMILEHIWDINFDPSTNIVDVLVCRLRDKIDSGFETKLIHTVRGAGYVFKA